MSERVKNPGYLAKQERIFLSRIGAGSVTNIVNEWKKDLESSDYESIRELTVGLKKEGLTIAKLASMYRRHNYNRRFESNRILDLQFIG